MGRECASNADFLALGKTKANRLIAICAFQTIITIWEIGVLSLICVPVFVYLFVFVFR